MRVYYHKKKGHIREQSRHYKSRQPSRRTVTERRYHLKKKYGLTEEQFNQMFVQQDGKCAISGHDLVWGKNHIRKASVDQIHPQGGYTPENTWLVCYGFNLAKNKFSLTELLEIYPQSIEVPLFKKVYEEVLANKTPTHNNSIIETLF